MNFIQQNLEFVILISTIFFVLFSFYGSFLGVVIDRIIRGEQFIKGRSHCDSCNHVLSTKDLIPVFSFLFLKGKCRYCKKKLSPTLFVYEFVSGVVFSVFLVAYILSIVNGYNLLQEVYQNSFYWIVGIFWGIWFFILFSILFLIFFSDFKYMLIPDLFLYVLPILFLVGLVFNFIIPVNMNFSAIMSDGGLSYNFFSYLNNNFYFVIKQIYSDLWQNLISAFWLFIFFGGLYLLTKKKGIGIGDVILAPLLGIYLSLIGSAVMWYVSFILGAIVGIILLILKRKKMKSAISFGPFLIIGFIVALFLSETIFSLYTQFFSL